MPRNNEIKQMLAAINHTGTPKLLVMVLIEHDKTTGCYDEMGTEIAYGAYVQRELKLLKGKLEKQLKKEETVVQEDIESAIQKAHNGEY